jgi:hypothetical protein
MTELERTQRAIGAAMAYLRDKKDPDAVGTLEYINAVLNPPPVYEPVEEIVGWVNVYQWKDSGRLFTSCVHGDEETATLQNAPSGCERISCQPIKVTVQREKKAPVEFAGTYQISSDGRVWHMDGTVADELHDKVVLAAWTEEPT